MLKIVISAIALCSLMYGGICLFLYKQQQRIIFFPSPTLTTTPADLGIPYTDLWIPIPSHSNTHPDNPPNNSPDNHSDATSLHGWWMPSPDADAPGLLYLHGNGDNMSANASKAAWFHSLGFSVLIIDYRGYGLSSGEFPSEQQVYEDADAAWRYLTESLDVAPQNSFVFGHSLGGAIAIELASHHPDMAGLIVEGSFTSILDMSNRTKNYGFLPIDFLLHQRFESIDKVSDLRLPVLYVHGTADYTVPMDMSEALYARTPAPKKLLLVPGAGHNNVVEFGARIYEQAIRDVFSLCHQQSQCF
ncbi:MAG: alpha/beta hydrolase [Leptolyngbyaceae bacterium]|nr:alpha/beta hydrolase [Leptolyngbyaceae bacterium]